MGGSTLFSHSQYETITRSSFEDSRELGRSRDKIDLTSHLRDGASAGSWILRTYGAKKDNMSSNQPLDAKIEENSIFVRRNSASNILSSCKSKPPRRFVSNKIVLELRSHLKPISRYTRGIEFGQSFSKDCTNNQLSFSDLRQFSSDKIGYSMNVDSNSLYGSGTGTAATVASGSVSSGGSNENENAGCSSTKKSKSPPTKIMLQLWNRGPRPKGQCRTSVDPTPYQRDRPAYAKRFMLSRPESSVPIVSTPVADGHTPCFDVDSNLRELPQFVLPPLPLGLRPPSPEPRSLLLNAPKKRRFPSPCRSSDTFDLSSLTQLLRPSELRNVHKRPVCRELRFGD